MVKNKNVPKSKWSKGQPVFVMGPISLESVMTRVKSVGVYVTLMDGRKFSHDGYEVRPPPDRYQEQIFTVEEFRTRQETLRAVAKLFTKYGITLSAAKRGTAIEILNVLDTGL